MEFQTTAPRIFTGFGLLLLLLSEAGCSVTMTSGSHGLKEPPPVKLSHFKNVTVEVRSAIAKPPKDQEKFMAFLEDKIVERLRERHVFETVYPRSVSNAPCDLCMVVTLTKLREPSNTAFLLVGIAAGPAMAKATVELHEQPGDKLIGSGEVEGESSGTMEADLSGTEYFKGTAGEALWPLAKHVVKLIDNQF